MVEGGAARFSLDATQQRAEEGELFVLEPEAVHTGMAAVPEGWATRCSTWSRSYCTSAQSATGSRRVLLGGSSSRTLRCALACFVFMPPWLRSRQVCRARALLAGGMTLAVVAAECGFSDQPHLTRTFKRAVGVSPGRYARSVVG
jgi:AraC-like DNA-binding protein